MFIPPGVLKVQAAVPFPRASPGGRGTIALPVCLSQQVGDWHVFILRGTGPCFCKKHLMIFALDFKKSFNTAKGSLAFAHVALPGMGSRCPEGQGPSNIPVAGSEVTLAPAQSSTVPVANGAHGGGSVPENPLSPTPAPLPDLSLWGLQGGGHQEGAGAAEPTLTASNGEPVCPGAGDRSRSQEHGKAADQGQALGPVISSWNPLLSFPFVFTSCGYCNKSPQT